MSWNDNTVTGLVVTASLLVYINSIFCGFVFDDLPAVIKNKDLENETPWSNLLWNDYWGTSMALERSHKSYRPFTVSTFRFNKLLFGDEPWSYHAVNMLLHAVVSVLYLKLCLLLCEICSKHIATSKVKHQHEEKRNNSSSSRDFILKVHQLQYKHMKKTAYIASFLFAVHPVHCEAVTGVVGRAELLSALFMIFTIISYIKFTAASLFLSVLFCIFAVASKEQGITVIAICVVFDFFVAYKLTPMDLITCKKSSNIYTGLRSAIISLAGMGLLWWRLNIMGSQLPTFTKFDNPASVSSTPSRQLTYNYILALNAKLLLMPESLLCDWTMGTVPLITQFADLRNVATILFWFLLIAAAWNAATKTEPYAKLTLLGLSFLVFPFLPASNLFFPVGFVVAERVLYAPSMGYCLLIAIGIQKMIAFGKWKKITLFMLTLMLVSYSLKTISRNSQWKSDYTLFQSGLQVTKDNAKIWNNVGHSLEKENPKLALMYFIEAAKVQPNDIGSHINVGRLRKILGDMDGAEIAYRKAKQLLTKPKGKASIARVAPDHLKVFVQLGNLVKMNVSRLPEADLLYKEAIAMRSDFVDAYVNRGEILMMMNKMGEAVECYHSALQYSNKKDDIYFNLGVVYSQMGNISGAVEQYTYAIQANPNHIKALYNSAVIFEETRDPDLLRRAQIRIERVLSLEPDNYLAHSLLGSIYLDYKDETKAAETWKKVLEIRPNDKSALFNMAFMFSKMESRTEDCIYHLEQLLSHYPTHLKGLMLYGDVLLRKKKDTKGAARAFKQCAELDPKNIEARHNYCVVILEEGRLEEAEKCMHDVFLMAPDAKFVSDHLSIIRRQLSKRQKQKEVEQLQFATDSNRVLMPQSEDIRKPKDSSEDFVYVEPMPKMKEVEKDPEEEKPITAKARKIVAKAEKAAKLAATDVTEDKLLKLEIALKEVRNSVKELNVLNDELDQAKLKQCSKGGSVPSQPVSTKESKTTNPKQIDNLKMEALKFLDDLEDNLK